MVGYWIPGYLTNSNRLATSHTPSGIRKNLQEKEESHEVLSPFEYGTAVILQVLILSLNAFETSCGINL